MAQRYSDLQVHRFGTRESPRNPQSTLFVPRKMEEGRCKFREKDVIPDALPALIPEMRCLSIILSLQTPATKRSIKHYQTLSTFMPWKQDISIDLSLHCRASHSSPATKYPPDFHLPSCLCPTISVIFFAWIHDNKRPAQGCTNVGQSKRVHYSSFKFATTEERPGFVLAKSSPHEPNLFILSLSSGSDKRSIGGGKNLSTQTVKELIESCG